MTDFIGAMVADGVAAAIAARGTLIALRRVTTAAGPDPLTNPPVAIGVVIDGAAQAGALTINLRGDEVAGQLAVGDVLTIAGETYAVRAAVAADGAGFRSVLIDPPLIGAVADGAPVGFDWAADLAVYAIIDGYPARLVDGSRIQSRDLQVQVPAVGLPEPLMTWKLVINADVRSIVSVAPVYVGGTVTKWMVQAR